MDRTHLGHYLRKKIKTLDFTFDEVHSLDPFLNLLGLEASRYYMSHMMKEISSISGTDEQPISPSACIICPKAHALFR